MENKNILAAVFFTSVIIMLINPFLSAPSSISDTDPSTYIIVPTIMLPLFSAFIFKNKINVERKAKDIYFGFLLFALFIIFTAYLHYFFSFFFMSFRLYMLIFPLAIASLVITIFGFRSINSFKAIIIYSIFASPILLAPIFSLNQAFAEINAKIVYYLLHFINSSISFQAPISIYYKNYIIGIGESCVGIGALIGLIMFLIPVAYLFNGKASRKVIWVISGFALMLLLNILRMFAIAFAWFYYGPNSTISILHSFAGMTIFYLTIIIMILISGLFELKIPKFDLRKNEKNRGKRPKTVYMLIPIIYALIYFSASISFQNYLSISPYLQYSKVPLSGQPFANFVSTNVNTSGFHSIAYTFSNSSEIILLTNSTFNSSNPIAIFITEPNKQEEKALFSNMSIYAYSKFSGLNGVNIEIYKVGYNGSTYFLAIEQLPYVQGSSYNIMGEYGIFPEKAGEINMSCSYDSFYSTFYTLFDLGFYNSTISKQLENVYCLNQKIFR